MTYQLHIGNCADVLAQYQGQTDLVLTSPPYDNLRDYGGQGFDFESVKLPIVRALKSGGVLVWVVADSTIDGSESGSSFRQALSFLDTGLRLHDTMIYLKKGSNGMTNPNRHQSGWEFMIVFSNEAPATVNIIADKDTNQAGRLKQRPSHRQADGSLRPSNPYIIPAKTNRNNVWEYDPGFNKAHPNFPEAHEHPATYPYALAADHIRKWTNEGDLVIDPMAGSGTTIRAAVNLNRRAVGIDIHPPYVELARRRMAQAVLL